MKKTHRKYGELLTTLVKNSPIGGHYTLNVLQSAIETCITAFDLDDTTFKLFFRFAKDAIMTQNPSVFTDKDTPQVTSLLIEKNFPALLIALLLKKNIKKVADQLGIAIIEILRTEQTPITTLIDCFKNAWKQNLDYEFQVLIDEKDTPLFFIDKKIKAQLPDIKSGIDEAKKKIELLGLRLCAKNHLIIVYRTLTHQLGVFCPIANVIMVSPQSKEEQSITIFHEYLHHCLHHHASLKKTGIYNNTFQLIQHASIQDLSHDTYWKKIFPLTQYRDNKIAEETLIRVIQNTVFDAETQQFKRALHCLTQALQQAIHSLMQLAAELIADLQPKPIAGSPRWHQRRTYPQKLFTTCQKPSRAQKELANQIGKRVRRDIRALLATPAT